MKVKNTFRRGFTLIELMIVIVILGILMGTILPRLTGAQSRARDTARIADLTNIAQALEVYFNDNGSYPAIATAGDECLVPGTSQVANDLGNYMKGGAVPTPASAQQRTLDCVGSYFYAPLRKSAIYRGGYVLASDVETFQTANYITGDETNLADNTAPAAAEFITAQDPNTTTYTSVANSANYNYDFASEAGNALRSIYIVIP